MRSSFSTASKPYEENLFPMEKMYSDDNRPSEGQLEDLKCRLLKELEKLI